GGVCAGHPAVVERLRVLRQVDQVVAVRAVADSRRYVGDALVRLHAAVAHADPIEAAFAQAVDHRLYELRVGVGPLRVAAGDGAHDVGLDGHALGARVPSAHDPGELVVEAAAPQRPLQR